ncbi:MAG TPA: hypothetical protein VFB79_21400 [Candidatus Angelobacter sp.]|nr:hypothetical protein [Candidatus Angelobacter sp.]
MFNFVKLMRGFSLAAIGAWLVATFSAMMQKSEFMENERIQYQAENTPLLHKMPTRTGVLCTRSDFVVAGSLVISGGTTSGTVLGENPGNLFLQTLKIQGFALDPSYPNGTLVNLSPRTLLRRRMFDSQGRRFIPDPNNTTGFTGAAGTFTLSYPIVKYWSLDWMQRPIDLALDTGMFSQVLCTLTNGAAARQFSGNDRTFTYSSVFWEITHRFQRYDGNGNGPIAVVFDDDHVRNIAGANARLELNNEFPPDGAYIDLLFIAETTNQTLADTIVNRITLKSGTEQFYDQYAAPLKTQMEELIGDSSTTTTPRTGLYYTQIADDGLITNAKTNISAVVDQANPGTDRLIIARRSCAPIPTNRQQNGGGMVKRGA